MKITDFLERAVSLKDGERQLIAAAVPERSFRRYRLEHLALFIKEICADVQRLMNVAQVVREQNDRYRFGDSFIVRRRYLTFQDLDTERDHMHDIEAFATDGAGSVLLG